MTTDDETPLDQLTFKLTNDLLSIVKPLLQDYRERKDNHNAILSALSSLFALVAASTAYLAGNDDPDQRQILLKIRDLFNDGYMAAALGHLEGLRGLQGESFPVCDDCWQRSHPEEPARVSEAYRKDEACGCCGAITRSGIYHSPHDGD